MNTCPDSIGVSDAAPDVRGGREGGDIDRGIQPGTAVRGRPERPARGGSPRPVGKLRRLGIPTVRDRVVQAALKLVLEPIFEVDFKPCSYGFRPRRRAQDAIAEIHFRASAPRNYEWVLERISRRASTASTTPS